MLKIPGIPGDDGINFSLGQGAGVLNAIFDCDGLFWLSLPI
jgi:hypothetical protein